MYRNSRMDIPSLQPLRHSNFWDYLKYCEHTAYALSHTLASYYMIDGGYIMYSSGSETKQSLRNGYLRAICCLKGMLNPY